MIVNGKEMELANGITILDLLDKLEIEPDKVVVEVDLEIIDKSEYNNKKLSSNSKVEIIRFVGGG
ncbi:sulfur carrier protein ThiS [Clostridium sp. D2Q-11]|uniref:Sulfur carrier protein ThiS n=1 Tax=Anaeromonas frigoriresistens TaxID=2683708 RepID=A0A942UT09_9FIRM|nr:sulfur carrier protein ThiS [Anaeromonas frigoriresistens]MBS4538593.1 sulfur carrier protein ThiS [Anaeromonas frigoriresistens]